MKPTQEQVHSLFSYDPETGILFRKVTTNRNALAGEPAGWINNHGYLNIKIDRRTYKVHQIVWLYVYGIWPVGVIDHINQIKTDNRIANLRDTTVQINNINKSVRKDNTTGIPGVTWRERDKLFYAACRRDGKQNYLGSFKSAQEALAAVNKFKQEYEIGKGME